MSTARAVHTASRLADGHVLVTGGDRGAPFYDATATAELYNPSTGTWAPTGSMATARESHTATVLADGRVLVAGGNSGGSFATIFSSAEIYNPASGTWAPTGSMTHVRSGHTATLLNDGRVLVAGGSDGLPLASAEIYDPASDTWAATGSLSIARAGHTATLLGDGRVLVVGGVANSSATSTQASAEIFNPASGTWAPTGSMATKRSSHTATGLADGLVLVTGGLTPVDTNGNIALTASTEIYNPATGSWTPTGSLTTARYRHTMTLLSDGRVLVAGGGNSGQSAEIYAPASGTWAPTGSLTTFRSLHTATLLSDGRVLAAGGSGNGTLASAEFFTP
jgi:N-acetylneuraminic acid mutarotase